jgi:pyridoxal 5'-phosphate synthase pdxS subunit
VDFIDESEVLTPADEHNHVDKFDFKVPFVCGCRNLGEALRRIGEGAAMIRTKGEAGSGNIVEAVRHMRAVHDRHPPPDSCCARRADDRGQEPRRALSLVRGAPTGQAAGAELRRRRRGHPGRRRADDAARRRDVFVGSGIFKSEDPRRAPRPSSRRSTYYDDPQRLLEISMLPADELMASRGW